MNKTLIMKREETFRDWRHRERLVACASTLRRYFVGIPEDAKKLYAVFTDDKPTDNNYTLRAPTGNSMWGRERGSLVGINQVMYDGGEHVLADMYNKGYRYLQVEWDA